MLIKLLDPIVSKTGAKRTGLTAARKLDHPEIEVVKETNAARRDKGTKALTVSDRLTKAAEARAAKLAKGGEFSHAGWEKALQKVGYRPGWGAGENIAYGQDSAGEVVSDWLASAGHRRNILDSKFRTIGVAYVDGQRDVWVQIFGRR